MQPYNVDADISRARTLTTDFYTSAIAYEESKEKIFCRSWQFAGDVSGLNAKGSCLPVNLLPGFMEEPLLWIRDGADELYCLSNVCTHRGNLLVEDPCTIPHIRCRYHGRLFDLNGRFRSMPEFREVADFPSAADDLHRVFHDTCGPLGFVRLAEGQEGAANAYLAEMQQRMNWFPMETLRFRPDLSRDYDVSAHWALYCENYLEGFHIPFVHAGLNAVIDYGNYTTELFRYSNLQLGIAKQGDICFQLPPDSEDFGKQVAAYYFFVFPNMMFNFYPWGLSFNLVEPRGISSCRVRFLTFVWKPELLETGAGAGLDTVELEDEAVVEAVQKGVRSRFYQHGRYSVTREQGTHHFHRLIAEAMNQG